MRKNKTTDQSLEIGQKVSVRNCKKLFCKTLITVLNLGVSLRKNECDRLTLARLEKTLSRLWLTELTLNITVYVELRRDYLRFSRTVQESYN